MLDHEETQTLKLFVDLFDDLDNMPEASKNAWIESYLRQYRPARDDVVKLVGKSR